jgi:acyl-homoserine lactone acylase PvdQ
MTLTSASGDIIDQYAETLCGGSDTKYVYNGKCREMGTFDAGTLNGDPVSFRTTVHGPVTGYATVDGKKVAISSKRSSYGKDVLDQLFFRRLSTGKVGSAESFYNAAAQTPQTFNAFYIDDTDNAVFTSGLLPERPKGVDPGLLTKGTGEYEWEGFLSKKDHPHGANPKRGRIVNWNQNIAKGFGTADNEWMRAGSVGRVNLLNRNLKQLRNGDGTWDLVDLTAAMNAAATQDVRTVVTVPLLAKLLEGSEAPTPQAQKMLALMKNWRAKGATRLDRDLDGKIDHPGAATMDGSWDNIANAFMGGRLNDELLDELSTLVSRFNLPPGGQYSGWYQYFDRDIRALLGENIRAPFAVSYCGKGKLAKCQADVWAAIAQSGAELEAEYGSADPNTWLADATGERIKFAPGLLPTTMRYSNRPSGYQQITTFKGGN